MASENLSHFDCNAWLYNESICVKSKVMLFPVLCHVLQSTMRSSSLFNSPAIPEVFTVWHYK